MILSKFFRWLKPVLFLFFISLATFGHCKSVSQMTSYPSFCRDAAENEITFANFKRNPIYIQIHEHVTYEQGLEYLKIIKEESPDLIPYFNRFNKNDLAGNPNTYFYQDFGWFSPTTLRYIKVAGDLRREFGNELSEMHIVEIGGGYGGQCKILSDIKGFATYTIVNLPECNALAKKYLGLMGVKNVSFIDNTTLKNLKDYDLVISNYAFSEFDRQEQIHYLEKIILRTPRGYITKNVVSERLNFNSFSTNELIRALSSNDRKGFVKSEKPMTDPNNVLFVWGSSDNKQTSTEKKVFHGSQPYFGANDKAITYNFSGGRFGDNLIAYFHAKWLAKEYRLPFLYRSFPYSDLLQLSERDEPLESPIKFKHVISITKKEHVNSVPPSSLIAVPYFPECEYERKMPQHAGILYFPVDWNDPEFHREVVECLTPKTPVETISLPKDRISIAVHVRRGGTFESYAESAPGSPLKFPPDSFYISEIKRIAEIFSDKSLYVYIFTDDQYPEQIVTTYSKALNNPNIKFGWDRNEDSLDETQKMFRDFYSITKFDCLIHPMSNFTIIAALLGDYILKITPTDYHFDNGNIVVDQVEIHFKDAASKKCSEKN
jgi:hypothetical protein